MCPELIDNHMKRKYLQRMRQIIIRLFNILIREMAPVRK